VAGTAPRDGRQGLAHVLAGQAGRDLRWSLNAARTDLIQGVGCHLPITSLHASAGRYVGTARMSEQPYAAPLRTHFLLQGGARPDALGISSANLMVRRLVMRHEALGREQIELGAPVSLTFDQLEAGDVTLDRTAAPGQR